MGSEEGRERRQPQDISPSERSVAEQGHPGSTPIRGSTILTVKVSRFHRHLLSVALAALPLTLTQSGCGFIGGLDRPEGDSVIYIGTVRDVETLSGNRREGSSCMDLSDVLRPFYVIDLPISFALDTVALPFTVVYELTRAAPPKPEGDMPVENPKLPAEEK